MWLSTPASDFSDPGTKSAVMSFLASHPDFRAVPVREVAAQAAGSAHPDHLVLTPARHGTDGFFAAVMERQAAAPS